MTLTHTLVIVALPLLRIWLQLVLMEYGQCGHPIVLKKLVSLSVLFIFCLFTTITQSIKIYFCFCTENWLKSAGCFSKQSRNGVTAEKRNFIIVIFVSPIYFSASNAHWRYFLLKQKFYLFTGKKYILLVYLLRCFNVFKKFRTFWWCCFCETGFSKV